MVAILLTKIICIPRGIPVADTVSVPVHVVVIGIDIVEPEVEMVDT